MTYGLNLVRVSGVVCLSSPNMSAPFPCASFPPNPYHPHQPPPSPSPLPSLSPNSSFYPHGRKSPMAGATANAEYANRNRPAWERTVKTGAVIYDATRITTAKAKRVAPNSPALRTNTANAQVLLPCPRCKLTFRARRDFVGHLRMQFTNSPTIPTSRSNSAYPPSDSPTLTPGINSITPTIIVTKFQYSSPVTSPATTTTTLSPTPPALSHAPAWSFTWESIGLIKVNQCLGLRYTVATPTSTALPAPVSSNNAWAY
ncbi:unnamed protein product [Schistocephalus solidus]|uniref:C2H2-type domain-containing protein n=1 Tax=Schistocephalus solidus TaxID=70667 RepID=A0A183SE94_SCHSO|nr:unnamed protein product [Schistocephalus solidus]